MARRVLPVPPFLMGSAFPRRPMGFPEHLQADPVEDLHQEGVRVRQRHHEKDDLPECPASLNHRVPAIPLGHPWNGTKMPRSVDCPAQAVTAVRLSPKRAFTNAKCL